MAPNEKFSDVASTRLFFVNMHGDITEEDTLKFKKLTYWTLMSDI